jgi:hypothetical protein
MSARDRNICQLVISAAGGRARPEWQLADFGGALVNSELPKTALAAGASNPKTRQNHKFASVALIPKFV